MDKDLKDKWTEVCCPAWDSFTARFENQGLTESGMKAVGELGKGQQQVQGS